MSENSPFVMHIIGYWLACLVSTVIYRRLNQFVITTVKYFLWKACDVLICARLINYCAQCNSATQSPEHEDQGVLMISRPAKPLVILQWCFSFKSFLLSISLIRRNSWISLNLIKLKTCTGHISSLNQMYVCIYIYIPSKSL